LFSNFIGMFKIKFRIFGGGSNEHAYKIREQNLRRDFILTPNKIVILHILVKKSK